MAPFILNSSFEFFFAKFYIFQIFQMGMFPILWSIFTQIILGTGGIFFPSFGDTVVWIDEDLPTNGEENRLISEIEALYTRSPIARDDIVIGYKTLVTYLVYRYMSEAEILGEIRDRFGGSISANPVIGIFNQIFMIEKIPISSFEYWCRALAIGESFETSLSRLEVIAGSMNLEMNHLRPFSRTWVVLCIEPFMMQKIGWDKYCSIEYDQDGYLLSVTLTKTGLKRVLIQILSNYIPKPQYEKTQIFLTP